MHQEYRHLEILDDITTMLHKGHLPFFVAHKELVKQYQQTFGTRHKPELLPAQLVWKVESLTEKEKEND